MVKANRLERSLYIDYEAYHLKKDSKVRFWCDPGIIKLIREIGSSSLESVEKWSTYANIVLLEDKNPYPWAGEITPDTFLFNYHFSREFTIEDYNLIKKKHSKIIINLPYSTNMKMRIDSQWNLENISMLEDSYALDPENIYPPSKEKRHNYKKSLLGTVPDFLWDTDCMFLISEHHEIVSNSLYYEILWFIHDLEEKRKVNPQRFILSDCNMSKEDNREKIFYERSPFLKKRVRFRSFPRFEGITSLYYFGSYYALSSGQGRIPEELDFNLYQKRSKKFLFLNRIGREHRNALITKIYNGEFLFLPDNFHFSYGEGKEFGMGLITSKFFFRDKISLSNIQKFIDGIPYLLDTNLIELNEGKQIHYTPLGGDENNPSYFGPTGDTLDILKYVQDSYFNLISETSVSSNNVFLTEKTFKCFAWKQPFIIWGNPYSLKKLHELGYKTFHPWINESYDNIIDPYLRLRFLYREIRRICEMDLEEVHNLYQKLIPIIEHNYNHFDYQKVIRRNYDYTIKEFLLQTPPE